MRKIDREDVFLTGEEYNALSEQSKNMIVLALEFDERLKIAFSQTNEWRTKYFKEVKK